MTKELSRLLTLKEKAISQMSELHIPISKVKDWKVVDTKHWGCCHHTIDWATRADVYNIEITKDLLEQGKDEKVLNVIIHELIHTVPGCWNHSKEFKKYAKKVNDAHEEYHISTRNSAVEYGVDRTESSRYVVQCSCGQMFYYKRKSLIVEDLQTGRRTHSYKCPICKCFNKFKLIKG